MSDAPAPAPAPRLAGPIALRRPRHCGRCGSTTHNRVQCSELAVAAARHEWEQRQRAEFAAQTPQEQSLALYDMIRTLQQTVDEHREEITEKLRDEIMGVLDRIN